MRFRLLFALCGLCIVGLAGCEKSQPVSQKSSGSVTSADNNEVSLSDTEIKSLANEQQVCAVTGEPLGSMGTPVPVKVTDSAGTDHTVLICCDSFRENLLSDPDKYLARLASAESDSTSP